MKKVMRRVGIRPVARTIQWGTGVLGPDAGSLLSSVGRTKDALQSVKKIGGS